MHTTYETIQPTEKLSVKQRILRGLGTVGCAAAGYAVMRYVPYDVHDSMALSPILASGLAITGGILGIEAVRGEQFMPSVEDSEQK